MPELLSSLSAGFDFGPGVGASLSIEVGLSVGLRLGTEEGFRVASMVEADSTSARAKVLLFVDDWIEFINAWPIFGGCE